MFFVVLGLFEVELFPNNCSHGLDRGGRIATYAMYIAVLPVRAGPFFVARVVLCV